MSDGDVSTPRGTAAARRPRVVFEQYVIPRYRVPFFAAVAERVDLLVIASSDRRVDGVTDVRDGLPFACERLPEQPGLPGHAFHPELDRYLREHDADVWVSYDHTIERYPRGRATSALVRERGIRRVHMGCDGYLVRDFAAYRRSLDKPLRKPRTYREWRRQRESLRALDGHVVYSHHNAAYLEAVFDVPGERITVAHNALDTRVTQEVRRRRERAGAARQPRRLVYVGRMTEGKGIGTLLEAFAAASRRHPGATLQLVGDGSERARWARDAGRRGLGGVEFLGAIYDEERLADVLCAASLFVLPGLGGLAINTAMAAGLPVVCSHGDGTELDLVTEGVNGWHVPPGDELALEGALDDALSDPGRLAAMGRTSAELIEDRFNLAAMVDGYVGRIEQAFAASADAAGVRSRGR